MRPSERIDQIAEGLINRYQAECRKEGEPMDPAGIAIMLCRAIGDYMDEEWGKGNKEREALVASVPKVSTW